MTSLANGVLGSTVSVAGGPDAAAVQRTSTTFNVTLPTIAGLECLGENIIIKRIMDPLASQGGSKIVIPDKAKEGIEDRSPWAIVVMRGPGARIVSVRKVGDDVVQELEPGDLVLIRSYGGVEFRLGGHSLIFVKPEHLLAVFHRPMREGTP